MTWFKKQCPNVSTGYDEVIFAVLPALEVSIVWWYCWSSSERLTVYLISKVLFITQIDLNFFCACNVSKQQAGYAPLDSWPRDSGNRSPNGIGNIKNMDHKQYFDLFLYVGSLLYVAKLLKKINRTQKGVHKWHEQQSNRLQQIRVKRPLLANGGP